MGELAWATNVADTLLKKFGKTVVFYREEDDAPCDESKPWRPDGIRPDPSTRYSLTAMTEPYAERHIDGTVILRGDVKCYLPSKGLTYVPRPGDYAEFSGQTYKVINVKILEPGEDRVLYEMQLRG